MQFVHDMAHRVDNYGTMLSDPISVHSVTLFVSKLAGEIPYAGLNRLELEEKIRQTVILPQPVCCPGAMYVHIQNIEF